MSPLARWKHLLKVIVSGALYHAGVLWILQRILMRRRAIVLTYHRVLTADERARVASHPAMVVDRDVFAKQMALLKRRFTVLSLDALTERLRSGLPLPNSSCLITFDDGWKDTFDNALPVLERLRLPAVVFLPVGYVGSRRVFWQEALTRLLRLAANTAKERPLVRERLRNVLSRFGLEPLLDAEPDGCERLIEAAIAERKGANAVETGRLVDALSRELGTSTEEFSDVDGFVTWQQVRLMAERGMAFGGHGVEHRLLTCIPEAESRAEVEGARETLQANLGHPIEAFCYPNGYFTTAIVEQVRKAGYTIAFSTRRGLVEAGDDPFRIGRLNVHDSVTNTEPMFLARLLGLF